MRERVEAGHAARLRGEGWPLLLPLWLLRLVPSAPCPPAVMARYKLTEGAGMSLCAGSAMEPMTSSRFWAGT